MPLWTVSPVFQTGTALVAQVPDGAITGGNARGANAVDWQTSRTIATQVASNTSSTISGGANNTASQLNSTVVGGVNCTASGNSAISGGNTCTASALGSVAWGRSNTASGIYSWAPGGFGGTTRGVIGRGAWGAGANISAVGDAQAGEHVLIRQTTDATATRLTADNAVASATNTTNLPNFSVYAGLLMVVGRAAGGTNTAVWMVNIAAARASGVATTAMLLGGGTAIAPTASNGTGSAWRLDITADTTNGGIAVTGTGAAATTINWSCRFANVEVTTAS